MIEAVREAVREAVTEPLIVCLGLHQDVILLLLHAQKHKGVQAGLRDWRQIRRKMNTLY